MGELISDASVPGDIIELEIWEEGGGFMVTSQAGDDCVTIMLDERGAERFRLNLDAFLGDNRTREINQLKERLENAEKQATGWRALAIVTAEAKDLLRRELEQKERENA